MRNEMREQEGKTKIHGSLSPYMHFENKLVLSRVVDINKEALFSIF